MMIQQHLQQWIEHPESLGTESLYELRQLLERYPYFQTARILYLKNLFLLHDPSFQEELRKGVLFVADLSVLFYAIEGEHFVIKQHAGPKESSHPGSDDRTLDLIDRFLSDLSEEPAMELPLPSEVSVDYTSILLQEPDEVSGEPVMLKGQELIDSFIEKSKDVSVVTSKSENSSLQEPEICSEDKEKDAGLEEVKLPEPDSLENHSVAEELSTGETAEPDLLEVVKPESVSSVSQEEPEKLSLIHISEPTRPY